jgi:N-acyl-D-amino-acid deacylase
MKWLLLLTWLPFISFSSVDECDILIKNGRIIDGTGNSWYYGNVAIRNGKISAIGRDVNPSARRTIDAKGMIIAPRLHRCAYTY